MSQSPFEAHRNTEAGSKLPKKYGRSTQVTAPGPASRDMLRNLRSILASPLSYLEQVWESHGDVIQFPIPHPTYLVSSPQGARDVLINFNRSMGKRTIQYDTLSLVTGLGLLTADTAQWKPRRRMLQPAFHHDLVMLSRKNIDSALAELDAEWTSLTEHGDAIVDIDQAMMSLALRITGSTLFGANLSAEVEKLTHATIQALSGVISRAKNPVALPLAWPTPQNLRMRRAIRTLDDAVATMVSLRRQDFLAPDAPIRDLLDVLLDSENELSEREIRNEVVTFIVAGHETVASGMTWAWHLLGQDQVACEGIRQNPASATQVFDEVLRLYPPAWVITRRANEDIEIEGYQIPQGALVIVSPWLVHRHPSVWADAKSFNPERFADGVPLLGYLPFGTGTRICIGREMARFEGPAVLEHIVRRWDVTPVHQEDVPVDASVTLRPKHGMPMRIARRSS
jgi:cytochrome P450